MTPAALARVLRLAVTKGARVFLAGNGGSFANCLHFSVDLASTGRPCHAGWPVSVLGCNHALESAVANDTSFESAWSCELLVHARPGDVLLAISTSGRSRNVTHVLAEAVRKGALSFLLTREGAAAVGADVKLLQVGTGPPEHVEHEHLTFLTAVTNSVKTLHRVTDQGRPAVFLDRDGTLLSEVVNGRQLAPHELLPDVPELLRHVQQAGFAVFLVSNQSAVGRHETSLAEHWKVHEIFCDSLRHLAVRLDDYYYCTHDRHEGCSCRKPKPFMVLELARRWGIDLKRSYFIGNQESDLMTAAGAGIQAFLMQWDGAEWLVDRSPKDALRYLREQGAL